MRSYAKLLGESANVKKKKGKKRREKETKYSLFHPHRFNAEEYFIVNIDLYGADVRLGPSVNDHSR